MKEILAEVARESAATLPEEKRWQARESAWSSCQEALCRNASGSASQAGEADEDFASDKDFARHEQDTRSGQGVCEDLATKGQGSEGAV